MKTTIEKAKKSQKQVKQPQVSSVIVKKLEKSKAFNKAKANSFQKLLQVSRQVQIERMGLNKALKEYLSTAKKVLTKKQLDILTFNNVKNHLANTKYKDLPLFSLHQITLVCNSLLKENDANTKRAARAARQQKAVDKK